MLVTLRKPGNVTGFALTITIVLDLLNAGGLFPVQAWVDLCADTILFQNRSC
jgi:hypothetical protein